MPSESRRSGVLVRGGAWQSWFAPSEWQVVGRRVWHEVDAQSALQAALRLLEGKDCGLKMRCDGDHRCQGAFRHLSENSPLLSEKDGSGARAGPRLMTGEPGGESMSVLSRLRRGTAFEGSVAAATDTVGPCPALAGNDMEPLASFRHFPLSRGDSMRVVSNRGRRVGGFTIVELMVTLSVAVILLVIAVPNFKSLIATNRLTTVTNDVMDGVKAARMEAVKRNASTQVCSNLATLNASDTLGTACNNLAITGAVFAMKGTTTTTQVRAGTAGLTAPVQLSGNLTALRFNAQGVAYTVTGTSPYTGAVATICTTSISTNNRRLIQMSAGSTMTVTSSSGSCP